MYIYVCIYIYIHNIQIENKKKPIIQFKGCRLNNCEKR